jgi:hypothetical protein
VHANFRVIHSAQVSTHHGPDQNEDTANIMLKFSLKWLISILSKSEEEHTDIQQKIKISLIWIEDNSYCISTRSLMITSRT